ncbi:MAG TPA: hypothetical protein PLG87_05485 [Treponemataceae bacterium]|jgi:hypothetical protein|nr:hypothetical protein [Treponemataceae bacterium]
MKPFQKNDFCVLFSIIFFAAVSVSCGLPVYNALYPPTAYAQPSNDPLNRFFSFNTADSNNAGMDIYQGVNIYYRIYNDPVARDADINSINTSNTEFSDNGMRRLQNMGYNELFLSKRIDTRNDTLIPLESTNRKIQVRLFTEGFSESPYAAGIRVNNIPIAGSIPVRAVLSNSFDFFGTGPLPESTDSDVKINTALGTDVWYVNAYAVSVGRNTSFQYFYSSLLHLGYITIEK